MSVIEIIIVIVGGLVVLTYLGIKIYEVKHPEKLKAKQAKKAEKKKAKEEKKQEVYDPDEYE